MNDSGVTGRVPSERDQFFLRAYWDRIIKGPDIINEAGKQVMSLVSILSGIYLVAINLGDVLKMLCPLQRLLLLVPYLAWLPSFVMAYLALRPHEERVHEDSPSDMHKALLSARETKHGHLRWAQRLVLVGLVLMVICMALAYYMSGGCS